MSDRSSSVLRALAGVSVVPTALRDACEIVLGEVGVCRVVIASGWQPFARGCGVRAATATASTLPTDRAVFVGADVAWLFGQLNADESVSEFALIVPAGLLGRDASPADPTLQLWQNGYTPVTVHRVPVDTGVGHVEVVAAVVRVTPPRP